MEAFWIVLLLLFMVLAFVETWQRLYPRIPYQGSEQAVLKQVLCLICSGTVAMGYAGLITAFYQWLELMGNDEVAISLPMGIVMCLLCYVPSVMVSHLIANGKTEWVDCAYDAKRCPSSSVSMPVWTAITSLRRGQGADKNKIQRARRGWSGRHRQK